MPWPWFQVVAAIWSVIGFIVSMIVLGLFFFGLWGKVADDDRQSAKPGFKFSDFMRWVATGFWFVVLFGGVYVFYLWFRG
jgi:hypothetical protein